MIKDGDIQFPFANVIRIFPEHFKEMNTGERSYMTEDELNYQRTPESFAACVGVGPRACERWRQKGYVNAKMADQIAITNGLHPSTIWPNEWQEYLDRVE